MHEGSDVKASTATAPDLDWSQVTETVRMLNLAVAQISMAMHEGEDSVGSLSGSFTGMVGHVDDIAATLRGADGEPMTEALRASVLAHCAAVQGGIQQSIVAFQFYDRLSQRLEHVRFALDELATLVADRARLFDPGEWRALQTSIRGKYSMQEEQDMFDALHNGASVDEALDIVRERVHSGDTDDVELF